MRVLAWVLAGGAILGAMTATAAYEPVLDLRAIDEATTIGLSRAQAARVRFHDAYRINIRRAPVDHVEVVTPFRRVVLAAEDRVRVGDRLFRQQDALDVVAGHGEGITVFVELTFHPLNTFVGVPPYVVTLQAPEGDRIQGRDVQRIPRSGPRVTQGASASPYQADPGLPAGSDPLSGGTMIVTFGRDRLSSRAVYEIVIEEGNKELARATMNLGTMR